MMTEAINGREPWNDGSHAGFDSPYQDLATAIVIRAVEDYKKTLRRLWRPGLDLSTRRNLILTKNEIEGFFHSSWYEMLTDISPDKLIYHSIQTAKEEERKLIEKKNRKKARELAKEKHGFEDKEV